MQKQCYDCALVKIFDSRDEMGMCAANEAVDCIHTLLCSQPWVNIIFAAAPSQDDVLRYLAQAPLDWSRVRAFHMDEYIGLPEGAPQCFSTYLHEHIWCKVKFGEVHVINPQNPQAYADLLAEYPADIVFLGIGENGHIAFNDPPFAKFDTSDLVQVVELEQRCRQQQVNDGCFATLEQVPTHAVTATSPTLLRAPHLYCTVPTVLTAQAVYDSLCGAVTESVPASILRQTEGVHMYLDADSASLLTK